MGIFLFFLYSLWKSVEILLYIFVLFFHHSFRNNYGHSFVLQTDSVISQAQSTLGALVLQRSTFGGINSKLSNVSSRLPTV